MFQINVVNLYNALHLQILTLHSQLKWALRSNYVCKSYQGIIYDKQDCIQHKILILFPFELQIKGFATEYKTSYPFWFFDAGTADHHILHSQVVDGMGNVGHRNLQFQAWYHTLWSYNPARNNRLKTVLSNKYFGMLRQLKWFHASIDWKLQMLNQFQNGRKWCEKLNCPSIMNLTIPCLTVRVPQVWITQMTFPFPFLLWMREK